MSNIGAAAASTAARQGAADSGLENAEQDGDALFDQRFYQGTYEELGSRLSYELPAHESMATPESFAEPSAPDPEPSIRETNAEPELVASDQPQSGEGGDATQSGSSIVADGWGNYNVTQQYGDSATIVTMTAEELEGRRDEEGEILDGGVALLALESAAQKELPEPKGRGSSGTGLFSRKGPPKEDDRKGPRKQLEKEKAEEEDDPE